MKVLVISLAGIGDTLLATPLIRALRHHFPAATLDALVLWKGSSEILHGNPHLNRVYQRELVRSSHAGNLRFLWALRAQRYDLSINAYPQGKVHYRIIAKFINAHRRLSHRHENYTLLDRLLVNATIEQDYQVHCIDNSLRLLELLDLQPLPGLDCELFFVDGEGEWAQDFARQHALDTRTVLGLHVGSGKTKNLILKRWPLPHYEALARNALAAYPELTILLFGGPEEREDNEALARALNSERVLLVPSRTIKQAAALLAHCDLFLSVDNAFMHLAATLKVPQQIVIESPTFNQTIWPYRRPFRLVRNPMVAGRNLDYYRYDGRDIQGPREHLLACMRSITPEAVFTQLHGAMLDLAASRKV